MNKDFMEKQHLRGLRKTTLLPKAKLGWEGFLDKGKRMVKKPRKRKM